MTKKKNKKRKSSKGRALKLPIAGETIMTPVISPSKARSGQLHIDRIYAQGGFVVVQMLNYKTNEMEKRMLSPGEAAYRMQSILSTTPKEYIPSGLADAVTKACLAAKRQTLDGENEFLKMNQGQTVEEIQEELYREIAEARKTDPELDEEMKRVEAEAKKK